MARLIGLASSLTAMLLCTHVKADVAVTSSPLIYGDDDRRDVYELSDMDLRALTLATSLALVRREDVWLSQQGEVAFEAPSLGEAYGLCLSERFVAQPALAQCSGVLVDDDLLLTAAHCIERSSASCDKQLWVFDYALQQEEAEPPPLRADSVFACRSLPLQRYETAADRRLDFAFVQLDRPVPNNRGAATLAQDKQLPLASDSVCVIGYPSGLPAKIDCGAEVMDDRSAQRDYLSLTSDTSVGSSGSGVFDLRRRLVAVLARGARDYEPAQDGRSCRVARTVTDVSARSALEQATYVAPAVRALCESGWKSRRLCGSAVAVSECGDGQCSSDENTVSCLQDCPQLRVLAKAPVAVSCDATQLASSRQHPRGLILPLGAVGALACARRRRLGKRQVPLSASC